MSSQICFWKEGRDQPICSVGPIGFGASFGPHFVPYSKFAPPHYSYESGKGVVQPASCMPVHTKHEVRSTNSLLVWPKLKIITMKSLGQLITTIALHKYKINHGILPNYTTKA